MGKKNSMCVEVRLFATLRMGRLAQEIIEIPEGSTVHILLKKMGIPKGEVSLLLVNGRHAEWDYVLQPNDKLSLFPSIGGG